MILSEKEEARELTEEELDALYVYLAMHYDEMPDEEKVLWLKVLERVDKNFYEDKDNGS